MNPVQDVLYRVHQLQASRRGANPLTYGEFCTRMKQQCDSDLTGLLLPAPRVRPAPAPARQPRFQLGRLYITPAAAAALPPGEVLYALVRHATGDWGTVVGEDWQANERALRDGGRLLSAYAASNGLKFWIITESSRAATTVLLPEDY